MTVFECMRRYQHATIAWCEANISGNESSEEFYDNMLGLYRHNLVEALLKCDHDPALPHMGEEAAHRVIDHFSDWVIEQFREGKQKTIGDYIVTM